MGLPWSDLKDFRTTQTWIEAYSTGGATKHPSVQGNMCFIEELSCSSKIEINRDASSPCGANEIRNKEIY